MRLTESSIAEYFEQVRYLTISEIAGLWAKEIDLSALLIERELKLSVLNLPRTAEGKGEVEELPPDHELPPSNTFLSKEYVVQFCLKNECKPPSFWFDAPNTGRTGFNDSLVNTPERRRCRAHAWFWLKVLLSQG